MPAKCDILLPVYNGEATVAQTIDSLLQQTVADIRIIAVDDGSAPPCAELLQRLAAGDSRIHLIRQDNGGIVSALNRGLAAADAEIVARMDADDVADPNRIELQLDWLTANPGTVAISGSVRHIDTEGKVVHIYHPDSPDLADFESLPSKEPYLIHPFLAARRDAMQAIGGYRHVHHAEDTDLYWRLRELGKLENIPSLLGDYRLHAESISGSSSMNGRIMAIHSQLAAISAKRRLSGRPDIAFTRDSLAQYKTARTLPAMVSIAEAALDDSEVAWFRCAVSAKMLELALYRPWRLEDEDVIFIRKSWEESSPPISQEKRDHFTAAVQRTGAKLCLQGRLRQAELLVARRLYAGTLARLIKRVALRN